MGFKSLVPLLINFMALPNLTNFSSYPLYFVLKRNIHHALKLGDLKAFENGCDGFQKYKWRKSADNNQAYWKD